MATLNDLAVSVINFGETLERVKREIGAMNDNQPKVYLTVEEAKEIEAMTYDFLETFESQFKNVDEWNHYVKLHQLISKRIEQVEGNY